MELNSRPHVLEYILSSTSHMPVLTVDLIKQAALVALDNRAYERLSKCITAQFPTPATPNVMEALAIKLLQRLSSSFTSVEGVLTAGHRDELREFPRKVELSLDVLKEFGKCTDGALAGVNVSPISRKRSKARARHIKLDPRPFDCMGIAVPTTEDEVCAIHGDILPQLQNILRVRVSSLRLVSRR